MKATALYCNVSTEIHKKKKEFSLFAVINEAQYFNCNFRDVKTITMLQTMTINTPQNDML